jgi:hypothetical protein
MIMIIDGCSLRISRRPTQTTQAKGLLKIPHCGVQSCKEGLNIGRELIGKTIKCFIAFPKSPLPLF